MKLDSSIYQEAQKAARFPRLRLLMLGVVCGAVVPTIYIRNYFIPRFRREALQDVSNISEQRGASVMDPSAFHKTKPILKLWPMLNTHIREDLMNQDSSNVETDKKMSDDSTIVMFSSIM
ncbi:hypothetical protein HG535_0E01100 [Zygotorulaspora mrakii]|uniref:Uncharacterized protein n=1 Tax=Zygotorulaspora mrakii TaxID=42260 RepID=A0A7H9B3K5_ZYGMR|nr:uncharacterized protein HG535_0E01100 [Zygotorulaspora mrakii]QLG73026.1 hypothetical protein HG535_0E01100 [Zygotorulaspora mrakii]